MPVNTQINSAVIFFRCVIPVLLSNNKNKLNGTYVYRQKHNYILGIYVLILRHKLHVSALNVGHLQVVHEELINKLYQLVWGVCGVGWVRDLVLCWKKGVWTGAVGDLC